MSADLSWGIGTSRRGSRRLRRRVALIRRRSIAQLRTPCEFEIWNASEESRSAPGPTIERWGGVVFWIPAIVGVDESQARDRRGEHPGGDSVHPAGTARVERLRIDQGDAPATTGELVGGTGARRSSSHDHHVEAVAVHSPAPLKLDPGSPAIQGAAALRDGLRGHGYSPMILISTRLVRLPSNSP